MVIAPLDLATAVVLSPRKDGMLSVRGDFAGFPIAQETARFRHSTSHSGLLARAARLIVTLIQRQMLSRDTSGFDLTVCSDVPLGSGLGALHSFDAALGLALYPEAHPLAESPSRARLASVCTQAVRSLPGAQVLRARHIAALRGVSGRPCMVDYSDGSVTETPPLHSPRTVALGIAPGGAESTTNLVHEGADKPRDTPRPAPSAESPHSPEDAAVLARRRLIEDAAHAFGTECLRLLPDSTPRVLDWLKAVYAVHGPQGYPSVEEAATLLRFWEEETHRSHRLVSLLRGRREGEVPALLNESREAVAKAYGEAASGLVGECLRRGASGVRLARAGVSEWVTVLVGAEEAEALRERMATTRETVVLRPGDIAQAQEG